MKIKNNQDATSAVIGVILMVAITVAIAATVYVYVSGMMGSCDEPPFILCGEIEYMPIDSEWKEYSVLAMKDEYHSIYRVNDNAFAVMKYAYENNCNISVTITCSSSCNKYITEATLLEC